MFWRDRETVRQLLRVIENQQRVIDQLLTQRQATRPESIPQLHRPPDELETAWSASPEKDPVY